MTKVIRFAASALMVLTTVGVLAQDKPAAPAQDRPSAAAKAPLVPLKVQLVLSRYQGEKKLTSVPYLMWVTANDSSGVNVRMGVQMPVPSGEHSFNYKDVGTNIDCSVSSQSDGFYRVSLTVTDSSVYFTDKKDGTNVTALGNPSFRSFTSRFNILLRDGQTAQYATATDQVSGEVMKIDATLNVLK